MADIEISTALRDLPNRVIKASAEERPDIYKNVSSVLSKPGINATIVKGICKVLGTTLTKYKDAPSQLLVRNLIIELIRTHHDVAIENMSAVIKSILNKELPSLPSQKSYRGAVVALGWTVTVLKHGNIETTVYKAEHINIMNYQSLLYQMAINSEQNRLIEVSEKILYELWESEIIFKKSFDILLQNESVTSFDLLMLMLRYLVFKEQKYDICNFKSNLLDRFVKNVILSKKKPLPYNVYGCRPLLMTINKSEFETTMYPSILKAMLRSPENVLATVGIILENINFECNEFATQIGKILLQNLYSKDELARKESLNSFQNLFQKCSDIDAVQQMLEQIFKVLDGCDGKISVVEYRINLIQGAGCLSFSNVPEEDLAYLLNSVVSYFSKILENENQEKVVCQILEAFTCWTKKFKKELPKDILDIFIKGFAPKSTTQTIRYAYLQWFLSTIMNAVTNQHSHLIEILIASYEISMQNSTVVTNLSEALCIACILLKIIINSGQTHDQFWNTISDINKLGFFSDKFLVSAAPESLCNLSFLVEQMLLTKSFKIKGSLKPLFRAIVHNVVHSSQKARIFTSARLSNIIYSAEGFQYLKYILDEYEFFINSCKVPCDSDWNIMNGSQAEAFVKALDIISTVKNLSDEDACNLSIRTLLITHHPLIVQHTPSFWENSILKKYEIDGKKFISEKINEIINTCINSYKENDIYANTLKTLVRINPEVIVPLIISKIYSHLTDEGLLNLTEEEYFIYLTPEGELFDKSVLPNNANLYDTSKLKRENKAYSYKEQLEELQLRREIDEKLKKEGKSVPLKMTQKQQDIIKNQAEKEKKIKLRLIELNDRLTLSVSMLKAACAGNAGYVSLHFSKLLGAILKALHSPLASSTLSQLYIFLSTLCKSFKNQTSLSREIAVLTITLENPNCDIKETEKSVDLKKSVLKTIEDLYNLIVNKNTNDSGMKKNDSGNETVYYLDAPSFTFAFEFLKRSLKLLSNFEDEEYIYMGIQFIEIHAHLKHLPHSEESINYYHPQFMPRVAVFELLLYLIQLHQGHIQNKAVCALLEAANMSSGVGVCATAYEDEITLLLNSLRSNSDIVRDAVLRVLNIMACVLKESIKYNIALKGEINTRLWIAKFDESSENRALATNLWNTADFEVPDFARIMTDIMHPEVCIQKAASASLVPLLISDPYSIKHILKSLISIYNEKLIMIPPKLDKFDREIEPAIDQWKPRRGVAIAISHISKFLSIEDINNVMQFMVSIGLGDRHEVVHKEMLSAALSIVDEHDKESIISLIPVFEEFLDKAPKSQSYDNIRQAVVILMGSLARHLEKNDNRIDPIVKRLIAALSTPSQQVQEAVANCLPPLMPSVKDEAPLMVKRLLHLLVKSEKYGERRGAAYGIAGIVKGLGILSLKQLDIMSKLTTFIQEKKNYKSREGALFAFEVLCTTLGRLFEPYIVHVLPHLLQCFGDSSQYVRQAADDTAKVVMRRLSAHGVKLVLPSLLNALDEDSWRTKTASVELLGAMAFCAPKQLSSCLPNIVPKLIEVLGDSHPKVQQAGADALKVIGSVIKNPEIQAIVPVLLKSLEDPSNNTSLCLQGLLKTKFVHFIDAPSLALIMPVVQRAFMDRSTETRKMAAQIIGNMYSLTDQKDLTPYLPNIIPGLKSSLLDPVPEVRAVSARALGAMVKGMGEASFEDLLPWLMQTLTSESSSVDRSGAAQGLSEVVGGLGVQKMHKLMPEIIGTAERSDIAPHVKDGYIMMFIYMPGAFPQEFTPYIGQIINPILKALADENEFVRDTALKAGQRIVNLYAETAVALLLPELERGLFDDNWRIRFSSVQLLGDLLYRISGVSGKMTTETASEDDNFGTEQSHTAIIEFLGDERRNRVLSGLYMGRSDVSLMVRQAALHVWKVVVTNTPRTLREILPTLFSLLLGCLASTSYDKRQVAARTLGDLVRKLGERVLPEIIPILESGLSSEQADQRQGVCIGLSEIMTSTSKEMVLSFVNSLVPTVRKALSDPLPEVREAAAKTFESLHSTVGSRALDDILPSMLEGLSDPDPMIAENTLYGLRQVIIIKSKVVLPYIIPQLTTPPINTKALSILVSVAGDALTKYLPKILTALLEALSESQGAVNEHQELENCQTVVLSVTDDVGIRTIMDILLASAKSENKATKKPAANLLSAFCMHSPADYSQYVSQLIRSLIFLMVDNDKDILCKAMEALNAVIKGLDGPQQIAHVSDVRQAVRFAASEIKESELPGFCLPKGITPLLPLFREAILNGLPEEKENSVQGLGEVISLTSAQSLQPSVVHITGPLIRILGDRFNANIKSVVLETLAILLHKVGIMLKQFLPQLQTTFLKALHDQNRNVRLKAGQALSELVTIHSRADPIFNEVHNGIKNADESSVRETMLQALRGILVLSGEKMSEPIKKQVLNTLLNMLSHTEEITRKAIGGCLGTILKYLKVDQVNDILANHILIEENDGDGIVKHGRTVVLFVALKECPSDVLKIMHEEQIIDFISSCILSEKVSIACNGIRAATYFIEYKLNNNEDIQNKVIISFVRGMNHVSNDVKQLVAKSCSHIAKTIASDSITPEVLKYVVPMLVNGTKEKNGYVKSNSELALISILRLNSGDTTHVKTCSILETGAKDALNEVVSKVLKKVSLQPLAKEDELDDSLLL